MPPDAPGTLSTQQSLAVVAFILQKNGFPAGPSPIVGHYDITRIIPNSAPGASASVAAAASGKPIPMVVKQPSTTLPSQQELENAAADAGDWLTYGKDYRGSRYSTLSDITTANVAGMKPVCSVKLAAPGSFEGSPVAYDGILYVTRPAARSRSMGKRARRSGAINTTLPMLKRGLTIRSVAIGGEAPSAAPRTAT